MFKPRPLQAEVLKFRKGRMGVSAVPGSGKTQTLSYLAARLIAENRIGEDQEILVVTLVNSAVNNFSQRIEGFIQNVGLLPGFGYRVRTLHGLAHDIIRERPDLVGLSNQFTILDERESSEILSTLSTNWLRVNPEFIDLYNASDSGGNSYKDKKNWEETVTTIAGSFIRMAKDLQASPAFVEQKMLEMDVDYPLLKMGLEVYQNYQRALSYRGAVDFDDLVRLALMALKQDPDYLERLRHRFPYILEDEAQDSSRLQEEILRLLIGNTGNWIRVGDPNQAIYETFTTASPDYLINYLKESGVVDKKLSNSGRSSKGIIALANHLIDWTRAEHPIIELRGALNYPLIEPAPPGDPQPNPPYLPASIYISTEKYTPDQELNMVVKSVGRWIKDNPTSTVAILVPRNERGSKVIAELNEKNIPHVEMLSSTDSTRNTARLLANILSYLDAPATASKLSGVYSGIKLHSGENKANRANIDAVANLIKKCPRVEDYLTPWPGKDWLAELSEKGYNTETLNELSMFRELISRWQSASLLPIDQLLITISMDIFTAAADLALTHKLALVLERAAKTHPDWRLPQFTQELNLVANNERRFLGFSTEDTGFDPDLYKGKVIVSTIHKAKGLEWDRVYILSVNNYDFPSVESGDSFISERWFIRDKLNLQAETIRRLEALLYDDKPAVFIEEGQATHESRLEYASERLRLLFVGITRARKELIMTSNNGKRGDARPALPLTVLFDYWKEKLS